MKKFLILVAIVLILLAGGIVGVGMNVGKIATALKPQIVEFLSKKLKTSVTVDSIDASVFPRAILRLKGVNIGDDLKLNSLDLAVNLLRLLKKEVEVTQLLLNKPEIILVKKDKGVEILGLNDKVSSKSSQGAATTIDNSSKTQNKPVSTTSNISLQLESVKISDGVFTLRGFTKEDQIFNHLDLSSSLSLNAQEISALDLSITASNPLLGDINISSPSFIADILSNNISSDKVSIEVGSSKFETKVHYNGGEGIGENSSSFSFNLNSFTKILSVITDNISLNLSGDLNGKLAASLKSPSNGSYITEVELDNMSFGDKINSLYGAITSKGEVNVPDRKIASLTNVKNVSLNSDTFKITDLTGEIDSNYAPEKTEFNSDKISFNVNGTPVVLKINGSLFGSNASIKEYDIALLGGSINGYFALDTSESKAFQLDSKISSLDIPALIGLLNITPAPKITGKINSVSAKITGAINQDPISSLKGPISLEILNTVLEGVNIGGEVLRKVDSIPFLNGSLLSVVPEKFHPYFTSENTEIKELTASSNLNKGVAEIQNLKIISKGFSLLGKGSFGLKNKSLDLDASIYFDPEISESIVAKVKELRSILNQDGSLIIPLTIKGLPESYVVYPDTKKLIELGAKKALVEGAGKVLDRALGNKGGQTKELIKGLLGGL